MHFEDVLPVQGSNWRRFCNTCLNIHSAWQIGRGKCESARLKIGILGSLGQIIWIMATNEMTNHELAQMGGLGISVRKGEGGSGWDRGPSIRGSDKLWNCCKRMFGCQKALKPNQWRDGWGNGLRGAHHQSHQLMRLWLRLVFDLPDKAASPKNKKLWRAQLSTRVERGRNHLDSTPPSHWRRGGVAQLKPLWAAGLLLLARKEIN